MPNQSRTDPIKNALKNQYDIAIKSVQTGGGYRIKLANHPFDIGILHDVKTDAFDCAVIEKDVHPNQKPRIATFYDYMKDCEYGCFYHNEEISYKLEKFDDLLEVYDLIQDLENAKERNGLLPDNPKKLFNQAPIDRTQIDPETMAHNTSHSPRYIHPEPLMIH